MDFKLQRQVNRIAIQLCYHTGTNPYRWDDSTQTAIGIRSIFDKIRWAFIFVIIAALKVFCVVVLLVYEIQYLNLSRVIYGYRIMTCSFAVLSLAVDFNLIWKREEMRQFLNALMIYYDLFMTQYGRRDIPPKTLASPIITVIAMVLILAQPMLTFLLYIYKCHFHFLMPFVDICQLSIWWTPPLAVIQLMFWSYIGFSFFLLTIIAVPFNFITLDILKEMSGGDEKHAILTIPDVREWNESMKNYRGLCILTNQLNDCICAFIYPIVIGSLMFLNILLLTALISVDLPLLIQVGYLSTQCLFGVLYYCLLHKNACTLEEFSRVLSVLKRKCNSTKYLQKLHKGLRRPHINIGPFARIDNKTIKNVVRTIVDWAIDLILTMQ